MLALRLRLGGPSVFSGTQRLFSFSALRNLACGLDFVGYRMSELKNYEAEVLRLLTSSVWPPEQLSSLLRECELVSYDYTGVGYFLSVRHPSLSQARIVLEKPLVLGHAAGVDCGFVVFIEKGELTIECYTYGIEELPEGFRESDVMIGTT